MGHQTLRWTGRDLQFEGRTTYGQPVLVGGGDRQGPGAKPSDLLPLALASCTAYDVVVILRKQRQDLRALEVQIRSEQEPEPPWTFISIHQHFVITGAVDEGKAARAIDLAEAKYCSVAATIRPTVALGHSFDVVPS